MKHRMIALLLALALTLSLVACGETASNSSNSGGVSSSDTSNDQETPSDSTDTGSAEELTTVRMAIMTGDGSQWYAVVGDETGIFQKYGIQPQITEFAAGVNTVDAVVTEQADIGNLADYAVVNRIGNTQENGNLKIIGRYESNAYGALYVNSDKVKSLEDLAGQNFVTQAGTAWDYWNAFTYEKAGIPEEDQVLLNVDSGQSAVAVLTTGEGVAFWASGTNAAKLEEAGFEPLITKEEIGLSTDGYYITTTTFIEENSDILQQYFRAVKETADWINENPEEAAEIIEKRTNTPKEQVLTDMEAYDIQIDFTQETLDYLIDIKDWAVSNGSFEDYDILNYLDLTALEAVFPDSITLE